MKDYQYDGKWKVLRNYTFRAVCGRPLPCPGLLGYTILPDEARPVSPDRLNEAQYDAGEQRAIMMNEWFLSHPDGFRETPTGEFCVMGTPKRRRRLPKHIQELDPGLAADPRTRIGRFPPLPAIIICPVCHGTNRVSSLPTWLDDDAFAAAWQMRQMRDAEPRGDEADLYAEYLDGLEES